MNVLKQRRLSLMSQLAGSALNTRYAATPPLNAGVPKGAISAVKTTL
ncbi:hypothetical protein [uncultured Agrobacterium sp.]|nr:hypothetical protein [uncultured Agrobacterium sp.]